MDGDEEMTANSDSCCRGEDITINLQPSNAYEFGQALNAARCGGDTAACGELLASTSPESLAELLSTQLDGPSFSFIMQALDSQLLHTDPGLVYRHLSSLHTADRFKVRLRSPHTPSHRTCPTAGLMCVCVSLRWCC